MRRPYPTLAVIAREHFLIPTLKTRRSDSLDFHDVAVWQVEAALKAAFDAGSQSAGKNAEPQHATELLDALKALAEQADQDCPAEYRSRHFTDALEHANTVIAEATGRAA